MLPLRVIWLILMGGEAYAMKPAKRFLPLAVKVNVLVLVTLLIGIGAITSVLAGRLFQTIDRYAEQGLINDARLIYAAIETLMMPGQAELAQGYFKRLDLEGSSLRPRIYRVDGTQAFVDNLTIGKVNARIGSEKFAPRGNPGIPEQVTPTGPFLRVISGSAMDVWIEQRQSGRDQLRIYKPIINLPKCTVCHGADQTFRGVLTLTSDITLRRQDQQLAIYGAMFLFLVTVAATTLLLSRQLSRSVLEPVQRIGQICRLVSAGDFTRRVDVGRQDELGALGNTVNAMIDGLAERFKLAKYVSGSTIQALQGEEGSRRAEKVIFFSDIRGFTAFSEARDPGEVVSTLNYMLNRQTELIHESGGDIDKYVGDEIFAMFSGDLAQLRALEAALAIQAALTGEASGHAGLRVGIGLHCGWVIEGMVGSERRADYTLVGDTVNLAARLCAAAGGGEILASEAMLDALRRTRGAAGRLARFRLRGPLNLKLKGKSATVPAWRVLPRVGEEP